MIGKEKFLIINKYQVDRSQILGRGAMGQVYLGYYGPPSTDKKTKFAVKQISINSSPSTTDSLLQEANLLRKMSHPYIVKYVDAMKTPTSLYLILQYCDDGTLEDAVFRFSQSLPDELMKRFIAQMVIGLKFMKDQKIIHRDIKPKNILIQNGNIKISDFGVAKTITKRNKDKQTSTFSGTIQFMSPQILKQCQYTYQTDVWSLAITIYFMVFKKLPWKSQKAYGILEQIEQDNDINLPSDAFTDIQLKNLLGRMLVYDEDKRLTIEQIKDHPYLSQQIQKLQEEIINEQQTIQPKQITKIEHKQNIQNYGTCNQQLQKRSEEVSKIYRQSKFIIDAARSAYYKLVNFKQQIQFLRQCIDSLRLYHKNKKLIDESLFRKCQFLLVKRSYINAKDLHQIILFSTHAQGNIVIPKIEFQQLAQGNKTYYRNLREEVSKLFEELQIQWIKTKQAFYAYHRKLGVKKIARQDAYLQNLHESVNLILAFNDCFLELFLSISQGIVKAYRNKLSQQQIHSSHILLTFGFKIDFIYDIMIILCFPLVHDTGNIKTYKQKKKRTSCTEFIYRISIAYDTWKQLENHI